MQQFSLNRKLGIASLSSHSQHQQLKVHTLLQDVKQKKPSINAFLGARYSRSADSVVDIAREIMNQGTDASKRLETIFYGYGHKSVGDMADLFLCLENVPMITAMRLFNHNPVLAGQERSTRFQNFQNPAFIKLPSKIKDKKILLVDEVDDTRLTLSYCLKELLKHDPKEIRVAILHQKLKPKEAEFPPEIKTIYQGEQIDDVWIKYPWEAVDIDKHNNNLE